MDGDDGGAADGDDGGATDGGNGGERDGDHSHTASSQEVDRGCPEELNEPSGRKESEARH